MTFYIGLTDDPTRLRTAHGNPQDWQTTHFGSDAQARAWEALYVNKPGYQGGSRGPGCRYGYWYTITPWTRQ
jgi:hypothetical protein